MKLHKHTTLARMRSFTPAVQVGMVAAEVLRAASLLERAGVAEAHQCLARARELLGAAEVSPSLPVDWAPALRSVVASLVSPKIPAGGAEEIRRVHEILMALCAADLGAR